MITGAAAVAAAPEAVRHHRDPSWAVIGVTAAVVGAADAFVVTALQGAVGTVDHAQDPLNRWIKLTAVLTAAMVAALIAASHVAARAPRWRGPWRWATMVVATVLVAIVAVGVVGTYNYLTQVDRLENAMQATADHTNHVAFEASRARVLEVQARGAMLGAAVVTLVNGVVVTWCLALCGGPVWSDRRAPAASGVK